MRKSHLISHVYRFDQYQQHVPTYGNMGHRLGSRLNGVDYMGYFYVRISIMETYHFNVQFMVMIGTAMLAIDRNPFIP